MIRNRFPEPVDIDRILSRVQKPSRYVANERNLIRKDWETDRVSVALCFPELYEIGMSNNGMKILYHLINQREDALGERAYCPWPDMEAEMRESGVPMFSHESRIPLGDFDVVGFSLSYELTYTNVLTMLDLAGIPLLAKDRTDATPLILGGGTTMANPEPVAPFFDAFLIGDGEEAIDRIVDVVKQHKITGGSRRELLMQLMTLEGVYVPEFYDMTYNSDGSVNEIRRLVDDAPLPVKRHIVPELKPEHVPDKSLVPVTEITQDRLAIEVLRGCTQGCRFCQAGYFYRPIRERTPEEVIEIAERGIRSGGWDTLSLISLSTADHSRVEELVERVAGAFKDRGVSVSLPSLRADRLSVNLCEQAGEVKKNGFTFAPETGSERLRRVVNKNISNEEMRQAAHAAFSKGWRLIKLYFMIGLPTENMDDVQSIVDISTEIAEIGRQYRKDAKVNASIGCFAPKPFTPFQWVPFAGTEELEQRLQHIQKNSRNRAVNLKWHHPREIWLEAVVSRGDRRLAPVILEAWQQGARFDGWNEWNNLGRWYEAFDTVGIDPEQYLRERDLDETLPWDIIDISVTKRFLQLEWKRAVEEAHTVDCRWGHCNGCGVPGMPDDNILTNERPKELLDIEMRGRSSVVPEFDALPGQGIGGGTYRLRYSVGDPFRFVGHSDLQRTFHRSFEIAQLPVAMSQGFSPRPKAGFGPPVPHGCTSSGEYLDVELIGPVSDLADALGSTLPDGLEVLDAQRIGGKAEAITAVIGASEYVLHIPAELRSTGEIEDRLTEFAEADSWEAERVSGRGKVRTVNLSEAILAHNVAGDDDGTVVTLVGPLNNPDGNNLSPSFALSALFGFTDDEIATVRMHRQELYDRTGRPMSGIHWAGSKPRHLHSRSIEFVKYLDT